MADLSKEYFDEQIARLATKDEVAHVGDKLQHVNERITEQSLYVTGKFAEVDRQVDEKIDAQTEALTHVIREAFEELYRRLGGRQ